MKRNEQGFTLVELLVVLLIIGILAAVATPLYLQNAKRARASEAVAAMSLIRQAERDFFINRSAYVEVQTDNIQDPLPGPTLAPTTDGLNVNVGVAQYFSNHAYTVDTSTPAWDAQVIPGNPTAPVDFLITVDGRDTDDTCIATDTNCAVKGSQVKGAGNPNNTGYMLQMDNSGRTFVSYDSGATWETY